MAVGESSVLIDSHSQEQSPNDDINTAGNSRKEQTRRCLAPTNSAKERSVEESMIT